MNPEEAFKSRRTRDDFDSLKEGTDVRVARSGGPKGPDDRAFHDFIKGDRK